MRVFKLLSHPPRLGKRLAILTETRPLGGSALRGECSQLTLFPCDPIEKRIKLGGLGSLGGKARLGMRDRLGEDARQVFLAREVARHPLDLGIVEQRRPRLVAHKRAFPLRIVADERIRRHVNDIGFDPETIGDRGIDVVPRVRMIRGNVKILAERLRGAEQLDEWRGEIRTARQRPDGCAVAARITGFPASIRRATASPSLKIVGSIERTV
jgi:hypothetical protein